MNHYFNRQIPPSAADPSPTTDPPPAHIQKIIHVRHTPEVIRVVHQPATPPKKPVIEQLLIPTPPPALHRSHVSGESDPGDAISARQPADQRRNRPLRMHMVMRIQMRGPDT